MGALLVRNLDDAVVAALKARAQAHGRSVEAEHRAILEEALRPEPDWKQEAARLRAETAGRKMSDSAEVIRHYRDHGWHAE